MIKGVETHTFRGASYRAFPGNVMLLNADEPHSSQSVNTEYRIIHISPVTLTRIGYECYGDGFKTPYFSVPIIRDPKIFRSLLNLHLTLEKNFSPLEQESELVSVVGSMLAQLNGITGGSQISRKESGNIKLIQDYLRYHYAETVSLAQLASMVNLSSFYFLRVFRDQVGVPPHEYQTQLRVSQARKLIQNGCPISQAALETGFFDQSHFTRNFRRIVGITPGRYLSQSNIVQDVEHGV
jgi:AraC-like DNA-binding protein